MRDKLELENLQNHHSRRSTWKTYSLIMLGGVTVLFFYMFLFNPMPSEDEIATWVGKSQPKLAEILDSQELATQVVRDSVKISHVEVLKLESYKDAKRYDTDPNKPANTIMPKPRVEIPQDQIDPVTGKIKGNLPAPKPVADDGKSLGERELAKHNWKDSYCFFALCRIKFQYKLRTVKNLDAPPAVKKFSGLVWCIVNKSKQKAVPLFLIPLEKKTANQTK